MDPFPGQHFGRPSGSWSVRRKEPVISFLEPVASPVTAGQQQQHNSLPAEDVKTEETAVSFNRPQSSSPPSNNNNGRVLVSSPSAASSSAMSSPQSPHQQSALTPSSVNSNSTSCRKWPPNSRISTWRKNIRRARRPASTLRLARGETYICGYKPNRCKVCNYSTSTKGNLSLRMQSENPLNIDQESHLSYGQQGPRDERRMEIAHPHDQRETHAQHAPTEREADAAARSDIRRRWCRIRFETWRIKWKEWPDLPHTVIIHVFFDSKPPNIYSKPAQQWKWHEDRRKRTLSWQY